MLAWFSVHEQQARPTGLSPLSTVRYGNEDEACNENEECVVDAATVVTGREAYFDLTKQDSSPEDCSNSDAEECEDSPAQLDAESGMESSPCEAGLPATGSVRAPEPGCSRSKEDQQRSNGCASVSVPDAESTCTHSFEVHVSPPPAQSVVENKAVAELAEPTLPASTSPVLCGQKRRTRRTFRHSHPTLQTRKKPHSCDMCGKAFSRYRDLTYHLHTHTGERPYSCDTCGKTFYSPGALTVHLRIHTGERPYSCDTCGKTFSNSGNLTRHLRTHTGEKPYSCDTCGRTFSNSGDLTRHVRTHTGEKPYSCDTCGRAFSQPGILNLHLRTHTGEKPYSCETCGKTFCRNWDLTLHLRSHTGEKPYSCDICGKTSSYSGNLIRHLRTHAGEKPHSCDT